MPNGAPCISFFPIQVTRICKIRNPISEIGVPDKTNVVFRDDYPSHVICASVNAYIQHEPRRRRYQTPLKIFNRVAFKVHHNVKLYYSLSVSQQMIYYE